MCTEVVGGGGLLKDNYAPTVEKGAVSVTFVHLFVYVCLCVAYIAIIREPKGYSVPKFGLKVPQLRCDSHTSFKVKQSRSGYRRAGHTVSAESAAHCLLSRRSRQRERLHASGLSICSFVCLSVCLYLKTLIRLVI